MYLFSAHSIDLRLALQVGVTRADVSVVTFVGNAHNAEAAAAFARAKAEAEDFGGTVIETRVEAVEKAFGIPVNNLLAIYNCDSCQLPLITAESKGVYVQ